MAINMEMSGPKETIKATIKLVETDIRHARELSSELAAQMTTLRERLEQKELSNEERERVVLYGFELITQIKSLQKESKDFEEELYDLQRSIGQPIPNRVVEQQSYRDNFRDNILYNDIPSNPPPNTMSD